MSRSSRRLARTVLLAGRVEELSIRTVAGLAVTTRGCGGRASSTLPVALVALEMGSPAIVNHTRIEASVYTAFAWSGLRGLNYHLEHLFTYRISVLKRFGGH